MRRYRLPLLWTALLAAGCGLTGPDTEEEFVEFKLDGVRYRFTDLNAGWVSGSMRDGFNLSLGSEDFGGMEVYSYLRSGGDEGAWYSPPIVSEQDPTFATANGRGRISVSVAGGTNCQTGQAIDVEFGGSNGTFTLCSYEGEFEFVAFNAAGDSVVVTEGSFHQRMSPPRAQ